MISFQHIKNKLLVVVTAITVVTTMDGCSDFSQESSGIEESESGYIYIRFRNTNTKTRADGTEPGIHENNENVIRSGVVYLYPEGNDDQPVVVQSFKLPDNGEQGEHIEKIRLTDSAREQLFNNADNATCQAYAVVNAPDIELKMIMTDQETGKPKYTVSQIKEETVSASFENSSPPESFVMDGHAISNPVTYSNANKTATGTIDLQRVAAKITIGVQFKGNIEDEPDSHDVIDDFGNRWYPETQKIGIMITHGVKNSKIDPARIDNSSRNYYNTILYTTDDDPQGPRVLERSYDESDQNFPFVLTKPFYSYENDWEQDHDKMTYLTLIVVWKRKENDMIIRRCYYMVPISDRNNCINRNTSYRVKITVGMLGSFHPDEPMEITNCSYEAMVWNNESIDLHIAEYRYLVLNHNEYVMNNVEEIDIPIYTSHETIVKRTALTFYRYNFNAMGNETPINITDSLQKNPVGHYEMTGINTRTEEEYGEGVYELSITEAQSTGKQAHLHFRHDLVTWTAYDNNHVPVDLKPKRPAGESIQYPKPETLNTISYYSDKKTDEPEYSRFKAVVTIVHKDKLDKADEELYTQVITIHQYPAISIKVIPNYYHEGKLTAKEGNVFVNNLQQEKDRNWTVLEGFNSSSGYVRNTNQYIIAITTLNDNKYIIGDPRTLNSDLLGFTPESATNTSLYENWAMATGTDSESRSLKEYYPTDKNIEKARWISPKFRVASSYGICPQDITYIDAQRRCAAYQELNAPAGRWRIPTVAEIEFISKLSEKYEIPVLFAADNSYFSAQGIITTTFNTNGEFDTPKNLEGNAAVRCVYDEWYWENDTIPPETTDPIRYKFTWGDRPRTNPEEGITKK